MDVPGRMVVESDPTVLSVKPELDTVLEPGDAIYMPKRPNFVLVLGDVNNPTALHIHLQQACRDYVKEAGGTSQSATAAASSLSCRTGRRSRSSRAAATRCRPEAP